MTPAQKSRQRKIWMYYRTLARIPKGVFLRVATRDMVMSSEQSCLVAWSVRERLAEMQDTAAEELRADRADEKAWGGWYEAPEIAREVFGGKKSEWKRLYLDVVNARTFPLIESAFVRRLNRLVR